jgi:hypothetical protein
MGQIVPYFLIDRRAMGEEEEEKGRNRPATARFCPAALMVDINGVTLNFVNFIIIYFLLFGKRKLERGSLEEEDDVKLRLLVWFSSHSCLEGGKQKEAILERVKNRQHLLNGDGGSECPSGGSHSAAAVAQPM